MKVLITRSRSQSASFGAALQQAGFEPVYFPVILIRPVSDFGELDAALENLQGYAWLVFTSVNAVEVFFERIDLRAGGYSCLNGNAKIAAIGPKTAEALLMRGIQACFMPDEFIGEAILSGLGDLRGKRVLLPRAEIARQALPEAILAAGGVAHEIVVYHTLPAEVDLAGLAALKAGVDWITFTSPSTVQNFVQLTRQHGLNPLELPGKPGIACIGPITGKAAQDEGFKVDVVADEYTTDGLVNALSTSRISGQEKFNAKRV
jgi:uroporphyrinogen III methyltransferase/synthase